MPRTFLYVSLTFHLSPFFVDHYLRSRQAVLKPDLKVVVTAGWCSIVDSFKKLVYTFEATELPQ